MAKITIGSTEIHVDIVEVGSDRYEGGRWIEGDASISVCEERGGRGHWRHHGAKVGCWPDADADRDWDESHEGERVLAIVLGCDPKANGPLSFALGDACRELGAAICRELRARSMNHA